MKSRWWSRLPQQIIVRQIRLHLTQRGHRDEELVVTTTLLDPVVWPAAQIATLYLRRWRVEMISTILNLPGTCRPALPEPRHDPARTPQCTPSPTI